MKFVSDPAISVKINKMKQRVRWQESPLKSRNIDQTQLVINDAADHQEPFSFLVIGDSGCGEHYGHNPQRQIAEILLEHRSEANFVMHTGDVIYQVGSSEYYYKNFISPYRELIVGGESPKQIIYDQMVFKLPFLPVLGNHDYYDLPIAYGFASQLTWPVRRLFRAKFDFDVGWHGSHQGQAYARAFLDYIQAFHGEQLHQHFDQHYTAKWNDKRCLCYRPGEFTRLPNRYYTFRYGGIDFFALDSNTFNQPPPIPNTKEGVALRRRLIQEQHKLEQRRERVEEKLMQLNFDDSKQAEMLDDCQGQLNQIDEELRDIEKRLKQHKTVVDHQQLDWLRDRLIASWQDPQTRGRVIYLHHPPYVTEATKWDQGQTIEVRHRLRQVLHQVGEQVDWSDSRPLVDLVLSGHAHCLEHLYTHDTGDADSGINWLVCGGSGHSLRRQRQEGNILTEEHQGKTVEVAECRLFVGRSGKGSHKRRPYSALRIDVSQGPDPKFSVRPLVAERYQHEWHNYEMEAFTL